MKLLGLLPVITLAQDIAYLHTDSFEPIWNDEGGESNNGGTPFFPLSFWKVANYDSDFCSLGDVVSSNWLEPSKNAIIITSPNGRGVKHPNGFTRLTLTQLDYSLRKLFALTDFRSDFVHIWEMNAPSGFTCLGHVATSESHLEPDASMYCCVRNDLLSDARYEGSAIQNIDRKPGDTYGIVPLIFRTGTDFSSWHPSTGGTKQSARVLKGNTDSIVNYQTLQKNDNKPLQLFETEMLHEKACQWSDKGSKARWDVSFWRAPSKDNYYRLGDIAVRRHYAPPKGFLLSVANKTLASDAVKLPIDYTSAWTDRGSKAKDDVQIWKPNCPSGFGSLGYVVTSPREQPGQGSIYCVNQKYLEFGSSQNQVLIWWDKKSKAKVDVSVFEQLAGPDQQGVRGFSSVRSHHRNSDPVFLLKKSAVTYWHEKPIEKVTIKAIDYHYERSIKNLDGPESLAVTLVTNWSDHPQTVNRAIGYSNEVTNSFNFENSLQIGVELTVEGGVPFIAEADVTYSVSNTMTFSTGTETTDGIQDTTDATIYAASYTTQECTVTGNKYTTDVPFTANVEKFYYDGTTSADVLTGTFRGVRVNEVRTVFGKTVKLNKWDTKEALCQSPNICVY